MFGIVSSVSDHMQSTLVVAIMQTANSEMKVNLDGLLMSRPKVNRTDTGCMRRGHRRSTNDILGLGRRSAMRRESCSDDGSCPVITKSVAESMQHPLSSLLADAHFEELRMLKLARG